MNFLRNVWYVCAWSSEVPEDKLLARQLLGEHIVLFRDAAGKSTALNDRCPHRFAPLSMGKLCDGAVQCAYHGLKFDGSGMCVSNPHGDTIPAAARVKAYPVEERHSMLWIWMGDPTRADAADIPDFSFQDPERWHVGEGYLHVKSNYMLENDNIMDLSHIQSLHPETLGSKSLQSGKTEVTQTGNEIWAQRTLSGEVMNANLYAAAGLPDGLLVDRRIDVRWQPPATMMLLQTVVPAGQPMPPVGATWRKPLAHIFTPETANTTHYWYSICFEKSQWPNGAQDSKNAVKALEAPFRDDDLPMLEAVAERMQGEEFWSLKPVLLAPDAAAVRVRRTLDKLIANEQAEKETQA